MPHALKIEYLPLGALKPYLRNARTHSRKQIRQIANSIEEFGFTNPLIIDGDSMILAGHGRLEAAKMLGLAEVPCVRHRDHDAGAEAGLCDRRQQAGAECGLGRGTPWLRNC